MENSVLTQLFGYMNLPPSGSLTAADGLTKIVIDPDDGDMDNTTLDLAVAATSARTGDVALNYDLVRIAAGAIGTGACTHTLGDGLRIGQIWALELVGAVTGYEVVVTVTNVVGGQTVFNLNSKNEALIVRWNGYAWEVLVGKTVSITGSVSEGTGAGDLPVTHRFVSKATGGAEALGLPNGTFDGQLITISLTTDGGDGTLTPATSTGWGTCVFVTVKDTITLQWVDSTIGWIVIGVAGTAAATLMEITA